MAERDAPRPEEAATRPALPTQCDDHDPHEVAEGRHDHTFPSQRESRYRSGCAPDPEPLLTADQVARWLGKPKATLYAWRSRGLGPRGIRVGNALRYRRSDVERWLDEHTDQPPHA